MAQFSHATEHSLQCTLLCLAHSFAQVSQIPAQILQISLAHSLPRLINCAAA